jgi:lipopolysaccharide biosynthesis glycosyltransferase
VINIFVGYDPREASAYHTFCDSVLRRASEPVAFTPLTPGMLGIRQKDGSNTFTYSRFLVPYLMDYQGSAIFADGDMICMEDIAKLWALRPPAWQAVSCVQHDYKTKTVKKYLGNINLDYPRKNWSSLMIFNCAHQSCKQLTPEYISKATGAELHRFQWCNFSDIGVLPTEWNYLVGEYIDNPNKNLYHYTLGTPCFPDYYRSDRANEWRTEFAQACRPVPQVFHGA